MRKINYMFNEIKKRFLSKEQYINYLQKKGVKIGSGCDIHKSAQFGSEPWLIRIGNNTRITQGVKFITHDGGLWTLRKMGLLYKESVKYGNIIIGDNCNISWDVIIMPNVKIGDNCVIACGAVVTKNVPSGTVWGGVPAKQIETIQEYLVKVKFDCVPTFSMSEREKEKYLLHNKPDLF